MSTQTRLLTHSPPQPYYPETHLYSKPCPSAEARFRQRAISFLTNITTGTSNSQEKKSQLPPSLHLIPYNSTLTITRTRNQEEEAEIGKIQVWVTSGVIKKSYEHCLDLQSTNLHPKRTLIIVTEYPGRIIPSPIKEKLNSEFSALHPHLDPKLTLSKLSNLREDLIFQVWKTCEFDPVTLAVGLTCFDRLLDMNLVNKINRKLYAAVCVLLAFKFIEENHLDEISKKKTELLSMLYRMDKRDLLTRQMILEAEFSVYAFLNFSIHLEYEEFKENLEYINDRLKS